MVIRHYQATLRFTYAFNRPPAVALRAAFKTAFTKFRFGIDTFGLPPLAAASDEAVGPAPGAPDPAGEAAPLLAVLTLQVTKLQSYKLQSYKRSREPHQ